MRYEGYLTVGELIDLLSQFSPDLPVRMESEGAWGSINAVRLIDGAVEISDVEDDER